MCRVRCTDIFRVGKHSFFIVIVQVFAVINLGLPLNKFFLHRAYFAVVLVEAESLDYGDGAVNDAGRTRAEAATNRTSHPQGYGQRRWHHVFIFLLGWGLWLFSDIILSLILFRRS